MTQVDTIQEIYRASGCGDLPAILERLVDDVDWEQDLLSIMASLVDAGARQARALVARGAASG